MAHEIYLKRMIKNCSTQRNSGFTLVELLVVIAIISILAGTTFMIINPAQMQRKAREAVLKANTAKLCAALYACASVKDGETDCNSIDKLGVVIPTDPPPPAGYSMQLLSVGIVPAHTYTISVFGQADASWSCYYACSFESINGTISNLHPIGSCLL